LLATGLPMDQLKPLDALLQPNHAELYPESSGGASFLTE
jgi:hypothetical protein